MAKRLESMYEKGLIHCNLKSNNLTWGNYNSSYNIYFTYSKVLFKQLK